MTAGTAARIARRPALASLAALMALPAAAQVPILPDPAALHPGQYAWQPETSPSGPVLVLVSLTEQVARVYRNGIEIGIATVSTGRQLPQPPGDSVWRPELAPNGPLALLVSIADRRCYAYRNGIEIGQAAASFARPEEPLLPAVYVVRDRPGPTAPPVWIEVGLFDAALAQRSDALDRLTLPRAFAAALDPSLVPGTSLYCALGPATTDSRTGPGFTILSALPAA